MVFWILAAFGGGGADGWQRGCARAEGHAISDG